MTVRLQSTFTCPKCDQPLEKKSSQGAEAPCPSCGVVLQSHTYPALFRNSALRQPKPELAMAGETNCYYHQGKLAVVPCTVCGRFLCTLCDIHINNRHLCPACMENGKTKRELKNIENHRMLYDKIALYLAILPFTMIFWFLTVITAPAAIFVVVRYWKAPISILSRTKIRFIAAFFLAGMQVVGLSIFFYTLARL